MHAHRFLIIAALSLHMITATAQQSLWGGEEITSPEIHENHRVSFRVKAPHAEEVKISGDWMPPEGWVPGSVLMEKDEQGLWTYTTEVLAPELYGYSFSVDGFRTLDPNNAYVSRDIATLTNIFLVEDKESDLYKVNDVPHGSVSRRWYNSPGLEKERRIAIYTPPGSPWADSIRCIFPGTTPIPLTMWGSFPRPVLKLKSIFYNRICLANSLQTFTSFTAFDQGAILYSSSISQYMGH